MNIYKRKYFEHSVKKKIFWTKLIFKTKEEELHFMISFEGMPENFKGTYPKLSFFQLKAPCYICSNLIINFYEEFMVRIYF